MRQLLRTLQLEAELAADQARRAVGGDQRPTGERLGRSRRPRRGPRARRSRRPRCRRAASFVASVANRTSTRPRRADGVEQDLLDQLLRRHDRLRRADVGPRALEALRLDDAELLAGRGAQEADRALPARRRVDAAEPLVDGGPPASRDLHRPRVEVARLRMPRRPLVLLDQHRSHAEARELERRAEPDRSGADDDHAVRHAGVVRRRDV